MWVSAKSVHTNNRYPENLDKDQFETSPILICCDNNPIFLPYMLYGKYNLHDRLPRVIPQIRNLPLTCNPIVGQDIKPMDIKLKYPRPGRL